MALVGTEVKSLREGQASLADSFATVDDGECGCNLTSLASPRHLDQPRTAAQSASCCCTAARSTPDRQDPRRQPDAGAAVAVLHRRQGQGGVGAGPR